MAEPRLRVVAVPPGGAGLAAGLKRCCDTETVVTAYDDARLRLAAQLYGEDEGVEFVPFGDLLGRFLRMAGEPYDRIVTRGQRDAIVHLACESLSGDSPLETSAKLPGMARLIAERLDDLRNLGIETDGLRWAVDKVSAPLGEKLATLAEIAELVRDSMDVSHRGFVGDRLSKLLESDPVPGPVRHLVVVTGPEERPVSDQWLQWAARSVSVDVIVDLVPGRTDLFIASQRTAARIGGKPLVVGDVEAWYEALFTERKTTAAIHVETMAAGDPLSECEWILRRYQSLIGEGTPPGQIAVFLRDSHLYAPLLMAAADSAHVPLECPRSVPLLSCGLAVTVLRTLTSLTAPDPRQTALLARSSYCSATNAETVSLWTLALDASKPRTGSWERFEKSMATLGSDLPWLTHILEWRRQNESVTAKLSTWLDKFRSLIGEAAIADASATANPSVRARDLNAQTVLQRSLADYAFVYDQAGHSELTLPNFVRLAERIWKDEKVMIEGLRGGVVVATDPASLADFEAVFVPGMLEGSLPKRRREDCLLHDDEKQELSQVFGRKVSDSRDEARAERDVFIQVCASARNHLLFSYPQTDDDRDNVPAFYLDEVKRALGGSVVESTLPRGQIVPALDECFSDVDRELAQALASPRQPVEDVRAVQPWARAKLKPDWERGVSPAELGRTLTCAFQAAFRYRLDVASPARRLGPRLLLDLPRRAGLTQAKDQESARAALLAELLGVLDRTAPTLEGWEQELLDANGRRLIDEWVEREFRARAIWPRTPGASVADVSLGTEKLKNDPRADGRPIKLSGKVTGVTDVDGYSVVQLYESSSPDLAKLADGIGTNESAFVHGLYLMCQYGRGQRGMAIEIDGSFGSRMLMTLSTDQPGLRSDQAHDLVARSLSTRPSVFFTEIRDRLKDAVEVADRADALAVPGAHCETCLYGEICRRSSDFGESTSPFGEDGVQ